MKHFKLHSKCVFTPVADLNISGVSEKDIENVAILFAKILYDSNIGYTTMKQEGSTLIAGIMENKWSISE